MTEEHFTDNNQSWWARNWTLVLFFVISIFAIFSIFWVGYVYIKNARLALPDELADLALLGDYVGGILGSILSFFSLILLLVTIIIQSQELKNSTYELKNVSNALKRQNFEGTFFQLLNLHHNLVSGLTIENGTKLIKGRNCFIHFFHALKYAYDEEIKEIEQTIAIRKSNNLSYADLSSILNNSQEIIRKSYKKFYVRGNQEKLEHYFRNLYQMILFVESHKIYISTQAKEDYLNIVRAQLSGFELILIFYNGLYLLYERGEEEFYQAMEAYPLLKSLPKEYLLPNNNQKKKEHYELYPKNAINEPWDE